MDYKKVTITFDGNKLAVFHVFDHQLTHVGERLSKFIQELDEELFELTMKNFLE